MLGVRVFVVCLVASFLTGCNSSYFREGAGVDLYSGSVVESAQLEDAYVGALCQRAGFAAASGQENNVCASQLRGGDWAVLALAGMNDIDQRCDAYLAWLDSRRRSAAPVLQQISDVRTATVAILSATGVGVSPIAVVAAAFGLASSTFSNVQSSLLMQINQSSVQSIVLNRQNQFRRDVAAQSITNRPAAIHALRSYLRICMPFTIETEINTTITTFERGGAAALDRSPPLVPADTVGQPFRPEQPAKAPPRARPAGIAGMETLIEDYQPKIHFPSYLRNIFRLICASDDELKGIGDKAGQAKLRKRIEFYEVKAPDKFFRSPARRDSRLDEAEMREIAVNNNTCEALQN